MILFYYSGTGNSLYVAKKIAQAFPGAKISAISKINADKKIIEINDDIIGFSFPVYSQDIPLPLYDVFKYLVFKGKKYIFCIATNNGGPGRANYNLSKLLQIKGQKLSLGKNFLLPGNSIILKDYTNSPEEQSGRLAQANKDIDEIIYKVKNKEKQPIESDMSLESLVKGTITKVVRKLYNVPRHFKLDPKCNSCKICIKVCPERNITYDKKIVWGNRCSNCLACYHWCPKHAISLGSNNAIHYHHPEIEISEMICK